MCASRHFFLPLPPFVSTGVGARTGSGGGLKYTSGGPAAGRQAVPFSDTSTLREQQAFSLAAATAAAAAAASSCSPPAPAGGEPPRDVPCPAFPVGGGAAVVVGGAFLARSTGVVAATAVSFRRSSSTLLPPPPPPLVMLPSPVLSPAGPPPWTCWIETCVVCGCFCVCVCGCGVLWCLIHIICVKRREGRVGSRNVRGEEKGEGRLTSLHGVTHKPIRHGLAR